MNHAAKKKREDQRKVHIFDDEIEPEMPDLDQNNKTILGIDSNNNQVRDDVEIWINRTGKNFNERKAMKQLAQREYEYLVGANAYTSSVLSNTYSKEKLLENIESAKICVGFILYYPEYYVHEHLIKKIRSFYRNTRLRNDVSWEFYNNSSFGLTIGGLRNDPSFCTFKIEDEVRIKESNELLKNQHSKNYHKKEEIRKKQNDENDKIMQQRNNLMRNSSKEQKPLIRIND